MLNISLEKQKNKIPNLLIGKKEKGGGKIAAHTAKTKTLAKKKAAKARKKGFNASIYKKSKGWGVSVTRN